MSWKSYFGISETEIAPPLPATQAEETTVTKAPDHAHEWDLTSKTYAAPRKDITGIPDSVLEKALLGVTTFLWECIHCREFRKEEVLGTDEPQIEGVLENADKLGPQFLERESGIYVIAKWQAPGQQPVVQPQSQHIPLR